MIGRGVGNGARPPIPEMLIRNDVEAGEWTIGDCEPVRGQPFTNIVDRHMVAPHHDDETARAIRAHEMMHARVSPGDGFVTWAARGVASPDALQVTEEVRVNLLCERAGFDVKKLLGDGSELAAGERAAASGDWAGAVYTAVAFANTASLNPFITGVRRTQPEWAAVLRKIADKVVREMKKVSASALASTERDPRSGLFPIGFVHTERIAEMVDRFANPPDPDPKPNGDRPVDGDGEGRPANGKKPTNVAPPPVDPEQVKRAKPVRDGRRGILEWPELRVERCPLGRRAPGGMGRKKRAANVGRNPRRMHRLLVDPERRVFDVVRKGNGGVVLIDGSSSTNFSAHDIQRILEAAPGATVAVYSASSFDDEKNLWVLADKGRMVTHLPERRKANGVDYPALVWAVEQRQHATAPVVWITDGHVHPPRGGGEAAVTQCTMAAIRNQVIVRPTVDAAVEVLAALATKRPIKTWWPGVFRAAYRETQGKDLRSIHIPGHA